MITSSGPICDICGKYILPIDPEERINEFSVPGIKGILLCDNKCKEILNKAQFWEELPNGPLRNVFEKQEKEGVI